MHLYQYFCLSLVFNLIGVFIQMIFNTQYWIKQLECLNYILHSVPRNSFNRMFLYSKVGVFFSVCCCFATDLSHAPLLYYIKLMSTRQLRAAYKQKINHLIFEARKKNENFKSNHSIDYKRTTQFKFYHSHSHQTRWSDVFF